MTFQVPPAEAQLPCPRADSTALRPTSKPASHTQDVAAVLARVPAVLLLAGHARHRAELAPLTLLYVLIGHPATEDPEPW